MTSPPVGARAWAVWAWAVCVGCADVAVTEPAADTSVAADASPADTQSDVDEDAAALAEVAPDSSVDASTDADPDAADAAETEPGEEVGQDATGADAVALPQCASVADCPAPPACSQATCSDKGACVYAPVADGQKCDDGNACSTGDLCSNAVCQGAGQLDCDDQNPCSTDKCNPLAGCVNLAATATTVCDDGNSCTAGDTCLEGKCQAGVNTCQCTSNSDCGKFEDGNLCNGSLYCDKSAGAPYACKVNPATLVVCAEDENTACQNNTCIPATGACSLIVAPPQTPCSDGDKCTTGDFCEKGLCLGGTNTCYCKQDGDCKGLEDGNSCNGTLFCNKATAQCEINPVTVVSCQTVDDTACQQNTCNPKNGKCYVLNIAEGKPCDDGSVCTPNETCQSGQCTTGTNTCQCSKDADCAAKEDGNVCNGTLYCDVKAALCRINPATVVACNTDDDPPCLVDSCHPLTGKCAPVGLPKDGTVCDDGNPCTPVDFCSAGKCIATANTCECQQDADCAKKEDGDVCNGTLYCDKKSGKCQVNPATVIVCTDAFDETCLVNTCDKKTGQCGMKPARQGNQCEDDNVCSAGGWCVFGICEVSDTSTCVCEKDGDCAKFEDGNLCNGKLYCDKQSKVPVCKPNPGTAVSCPSVGDTACSKNTCQPLTGKCAATAVVGQCSDNNLCTVGEGCKGGVCGGGIGQVCDDGDLCTTDSCLPSFGCVAVPKESAGCDDKNACTVDSCEPKAGCIHNPLVALCDDSDSCTTKDTCEGGKCIGKAVACDDQNECTTDSCIAKSGCSFVHNLAPCSDGSVCTAGDKCASGKCAAGATTVSCDDKNACTEDSCDGTKGCIAVPNVAKCDDGNACTTGDICKAGSCIGLFGACDDNNACTDDSCAVGKCTNANNAAECSDGNACTSGDKCSLGKCAGTGKLACDDGKVCTEDSCDPKTGCATVAKSGACDDGDVCTTQDSCANGFCGGAKKVCDDGNACTDDSCDSKAGCTAKANSAACSDGNQCTAGDACASGTCKGGAPSKCDDSDACTQDGCNVANGLCTHLDTTLSQCDDKNPCTDDLCGAKLGCGHSNNTKACTDGNPCTTSDTCKGGLCVATASLNCDDGKGCTDDSCDPKQGCVYGNNTKPCDDGIGCTQSDACSDGNCKGTINCDDKKPCTQDSCDVKTGTCVTSPLSVGACDDGNVCTEGEACKSGVCVPAKLKDCEDGNVCTDDPCDKVQGCDHVAIAGTCDSKQCTFNDSCAAKVCVSSKVARLWETTTAPLGGAQNYPTSVTVADDGILVTVLGGAANDVYTDAQYGATGYLLKYDFAGKLIKTVDLWALAQIGDVRKVLVDAQGSVYVIGNGQQATGGRIARLDKNLGLMFSKTISCNFASGGPSTAYGAAFAMVNGYQAIAITGHGQAGNQSTLAGFITACGLTLEFTAGCYVYNAAATSGGSSLRAVAQRPDGKIVATGTTSEAGVVGGTDVLVAVVEPGLKVFKTLSFGTAGNDMGRAVATNADNSFYVSGFVAGNGADLFLQRLDATVNEQWKVTLAAGKDGSGEALLAHPDGGVLVAGYSIDGASSEGSYLWRYSNEGTMRVERNYSTSSYELLRALSPMPSGDLVLLGFTRGASASLWRLRLLRTDAWGFDTCGKSNLCQQKPWAGCDDGKPCSFDQCITNGGCTTVFGSLMCSDNNACTAADACDGTQSCVGTKVVCDDKNPCTADTCNAATGCINDALPDTTPCGGGKACKAGVCQ